MNPYAALAPSHPAPEPPPPLQTLGATDVVVSAEGLNKLTPSKNAEIVSLLSGLYLTPGSAEPEGYTRMVALPKDEAKAVGGNTQASALASLKAQVLPILVDYKGASKSSVTVYVAQSLTAAATLAQPGSNKAIFDPNQAPAKKEKAEGSTIAVGAAIGGVAGFLAAGPVGGVAGAGAGALLVNWLA